MDFKKEILKLVKKKIGDIVQLEVPPDKNFGDYSFPCFPLSKKLKKSPNHIAEDLSRKFKADFLEKVEAKAGYVNFFIKKDMLIKSAVENALKKDYGELKSKSKVVIEFPSPNTNKPLHLGHVRNILLGMSVSNLLEFAGNKVIKVNMNNDRGIHICKSMLAYKKWGKGKSSDKKGDHFVGDFYVRFENESKKNKELEKEAEEMLIDWENGRKDVVDLWKKMNGWAVKGFNETYDKFNLKFDKTYNESEVYREGKEIVYDGLKKGLFEKDDNGAVVVDLTKKGMDKKVLLRADGTSIYITQDLYLAKKKFDDFKMDKSIYVVASEQNYHFKVLFEILKMMKFRYADNCHHLSYGMVYLPEGKMKSREGKVVDADDIIEEMENLARAEVKKRYNNLNPKEIERRAKAIGMAALKFYILKYDPAKDIHFDPKESISFEGETGPYLQYSVARINSIFRKHGKDVKKADLSKLTKEEEYLIAKMIHGFPDVAEEAASSYKPHLVARYLLEMSQVLNRYYEKYHVLDKEDSIRNARLMLLKAARQIFVIGFGLLEIEALEEM